MKVRTQAIANTPDRKRGHTTLTSPMSVSSRSTNSPINQILHLQRTIGNRAVLRLIKSGALQAKLKIGRPNDKYEQEADRVADQVMVMPEPKLQRQAENEEEEETVQAKPLADQITPLVQRQVESEEDEEPIPEEISEEENVPDEEEEEPVQTKLADGVHIRRQEEKTIQTKANAGQTPVVTPNLASRINSLKGGGQPLPKSVRNYFESRFGTDFSQVRVHTDSKAAETAKSINAKTFTSGKDVVFGAGQYSTGTSTGKRLLAHELTHVIQQGEGRTRSKAQHRESIESDLNDDGKERILTPFLAATARPAVSATVSVGRPGVQLWQAGGAKGEAAQIVADARKLTTRARATLDDDRLSGFARYKSLNSMSGQLSALRSRILRSVKKAPEALRKPMWVQIGELGRLHSKCFLKAARLWPKVRRSKEYRRYKAEQARKKQAERRMKERVARVNEVTAGPVFEAFDAAGKAIARARRALTPPVVVPNLWRTRTRVMTRKRLLADAVVRNENKPTTPDEKSWYANYSADRVRKWQQLIKRNSGRKGRFAQSMAHLKRARSQLLRYLRNGRSFNRMVSRSNRRLIRDMMDRRVVATGHLNEQCHNSRYRARIAVSRGKIGLRNAQKAVNNRGDRRAAVLAKRAKEIANEKWKGGVDEQRIHKALARYPKWLRNIIIKYTGLTYGNASDVQKWRKALARYSKWLRNIINKYIDLMYGKDGQKWRQAKGLPDVHQLVCDQLAEIIAKQRGLKKITPGLTGQTRWYMRQARKAGQMKRPAWFKPVKNKRDLPLGSCLFSLSWSSKASKWQVAADQNGFSPNILGLQFVAGHAGYPMQELTAANWRKRTQEARTKGVGGAPTPGRYEYWHVKPGANVDFFPNKSYKSVLAMGCWLRFKNNPYEIEILKWAHAATVVEVLKDGTVVCYETGGGPARPQSARNIKGLKNNPKYFVGYAKPLPKKPS